MMDFSLSHEQEEQVEKARAFTKEWISPKAVEYDRSGEFPLEICREAFKQGLMNHFYIQCSLTRNFRVSNVYRHFQD